MKTIITACCPYGNLGKIFFILQQAGLEVEIDAFGQWHDRIFGPSGTVDNLQIDFALVQGSIAEEDIAGMISGATSSLLPADGRCQRLLDSWAAKFPETKFLLFYSRAESALAFACRHDIEPQQALENWQAASGQLLNFQRCHRRQAILLDMDAAIRQPQAFLDICRRFGLTLDSLLEITAPVGDPLSLERYLAQQLVAKMPEVQSLQTELEASAQPFDDLPPSEMQILELFNLQSQQLVHQRQLQEQLDATVKKLETAESASKENELLLLQLHQMQEELEQIFLQKQQLEQQTDKDQVTQTKKQAQLDQLTKARDEQQVQLADLQQLNQDLETAIAEVVQKNESLALHLHQVQEELGKKNHQRQKLEQQAEKEQAAQKEKQAQLDQITKARDEQAKLYSQQQTKLEQLQLAHQAMEATTKELTQENELLLLQLHQVQEELEQIFLQKQQLEQQVEKDQAAQTKKQAQLDQLTKARDEQAKLYSEQQAKLEQAQQAKQAWDATTKELTQENELLLLQLHQVQEELEQIFLQKQQLERQTHQLVETVKNEKNEEVQKVKDELLHKARELEKLHQRDHKLKQSVSWKITSPIRAIAKPFKKLSKDETKIEEQINLLRSCELFDAAWYTATNEDVAENRYDPVEHYVRFGAAEGRDPSPLFSTRRYLENNPDVADAGMNPLLHYTQYGMAEKRCIE